MMKAVASLVRERQIRCEVSLENMMACGIGICLCCVEPTCEGMCVSVQRDRFLILRIYYGNENDE